MSPSVGSTSNDTPSFPRVSGDEPRNVSANLFVASFSPRERG